MSFALRHKNDVLILRYLSAHGYLLEYKILEDNKIKAEKKFSLPEVISLDTIYLWDLGEY